MRRGVLISAVAVAVGVLLDLVLGADVPGYAAAIGLGGCLAIIVVSKWLGKVWLQQPADYYEREEHG